MKLFNKEIKLVLMTQKIQKNYRLKEIKK